MRQRCWCIVAGLVMLLPMTSEAAARPTAGGGTLVIMPHAESPSRFFRAFYREFTRVVDQWWEEFGKHETAAYWHVSVREPVLAGQRLPILISVRKDGEWLVKCWMIPREDSDPVISARAAADKTMQKIERWGWKRYLVKRGVEEGTRWLWYR